MKTLKYIMKTSAQKIFNVKFATFCAAFLILSWTYDQPYLQFVKEKNYPISWCIFPFYMSSFGRTAAIADRITAKKDLIRIPAIWLSAQRSLPVRIT